jgi:hypothetical protein
VVATREPRRDPEPQLADARASKPKQQGRGQAAPDSGPPARVVRPPREGQRSQVSKRAPFGTQSELERRMPPPAPRFREPAAQRREKPPVETTHAVPRRRTASPTTERPERVERTKPTHVERTKPQRVDQAKPQRVEQAKPERVERVRPERSAPSVRREQAAPAPRELPGEPANRVYGGRHAERQGSPQREPQSLQRAPRDEGTREAHPSQRAEGGSGYEERRGKSRER